MPVHASRSNKTQEDVARAEADIRKAEIEIDRTKDVLEDDLRVPAEPRPDDPISDDVPIFAPASAYVIRKNVTPGKTVDRVMDTFVLGDLSKVWMLASIREETLSSVHLGQPVTVTIPGDPAARYSGRITNLGQEFDKETRLLEVRIELSNPNNRLKPEMLASAEIPIGTTKPVITVPSDAVQQVNGQDVVFVKTSNDHFATHPVRTGETAAGRTTILEGIKAGDMVVFTAASFSNRSCSNPHWRVSNCDVEPNHRSHSPLPLDGSRGNHRVPRSRRLCAVHHSGGSVSGSHEQPGGGRHRCAVAAADRSGATRHLSDRARDARAAEQGGSPLAVEARLVDGDGRLRRFRADVFRASARERAPAADLLNSAAGRAAVAWLAGDRVRRTLSVHAVTAR